MMTAPAMPTSHVPPATRGRPPSSCAPCRSATAAAGAREDLQRAEREARVDRGRGRRSRRACPTSSVVSCGRTACTKRHSAYAAKPAASSTSTTEPSVPASCFSAPWRLVALPPTPAATPIASTPTSPYETPFATRPIRASASYQPLPRPCRGARLRRCSTHGQRSKRRASGYVSLYSGPDRPRAASGAALGGDRAALHAVRRREPTATMPSPPRCRSRTPAPGTCCAHSSATRAAPALDAMWFGWSSRVLLPDANTDESLSKVSLPSGTGSAPRDRCSAAALGVGLGRQPPDRRACPWRSSCACERAADEEAATEHLPHVAHLLEVAPDEAVAHRSVVRRERRRGRRAAAAPPRTRLRRRAGPTRSRSARP